MNVRLGTHRQYRASLRKKVNVYLDDKVLQYPLHLRLPRRIFVCSMTDLFGEWVPDEWLDSIFGVMTLCQKHIFQVLTKRPERMRDYLVKLADRDILPTRIVDSASKLMPARDLRNLCWNYPVWPLPNVWSGASVEDQRRCDERLPLLRDTPAAVRWISYEPALELVNLRLMQDSHRGRISWVVVGGESGHGARAFDTQWAMSAVLQCRDAGVACFVKQITNGGRKVPFDSWPSDLKIREYPNA